MDIDIDTLRCKVAEAAVLTYAPELAGEFADCQALLEAEAAQSTLRLLDWALEHLED